MARRSRDQRETEPFHTREARPPLPARVETQGGDAPGMTHEQLVDALRAVDGLVDVGRDPPNFHFRSRPFLHFHTLDEGTYADVKFGSGDFESIWITTALERASLFARVCEHVESLQHTKKVRRGRER